MFENLKVLSVSTAFAVMCIVPAVAQAQNDSGAKKLPLQQLLNMPELQQRETVKAFLDSQLKSQQVAGAARDVQNRELVYLPIQQAVLEGIRRKLAVKIARDNVDASRQLINEAEAVFDPNFTVTVAYNRNNKHKRTKFGTVIEKAFAPFAPGHKVSIPTAPGNPAPQVNELGFRVVEGGVVDRLIIASQENDFNAPKEPTVLTVAVSQQLPWGPSMSLSVSPTYNHRNYDDLGHSYNADFTSKAVLALSIPVPGTKDFGPLAFQDVAIKLAQIEDERRGWDVRQLINNTLRDINLAYWELVRSVENLHVTIQNRDLVEVQVESTRRLFEARVVTSYDTALVEEELASAKLSEEIARNAVVNAGNTLTGLIEDTHDGTRGRIYLPVDYFDYLTSRLELDTGKVMSRALKHRPDLNSQRISLESADLDRSFAKQQTKADLNLSGSWTTNQKGQDADEYGYQHVWDSIGQVVEPDVLDQNYSLTYVRPRLNRSANAAYATARYSALSQQLQVDKTEDVVTQEINNALSALYSARRRVETSNQTVKLSEFAFDRIKRRREVGGAVGALELLSTIRAVLGARLSRVSALVDNKQAEINLLHAEGTIANEYPEQLARNDFERRRLSLLSENSALSWFSSVFN